MKPIKFGIVGLSNVKIETHATEQECADYEHINAQRDKKRSLERMAFDDARRRYAMDGATETRYFMQD